VFISSPDNIWDYICYTVVTYSTNPPRRQFIIRPIRNMLDEYLFLPEIKYIKHGDTNWEVGIPEKFRKSLTKSSSKISFSWKGDRSMEVSLHETHQCS